MKLSTGTIGTLLFTAVAITAFVFMAKRPAIDSNAMNFGMPLATASSAEKAVEEKMPEAPIEAEVTAPATEVEPAKVEETTMPAETSSMPSTTDGATEAAPETKTEEMPKDAPVAN